MKFYSNVLALALIGGATAFAPKAQKPSTTALNSQDAGPVFPGTSIASSTPSDSVAGGLAISQDVWKTSKSQELIQGSTLRTWSFQTTAIERVGIFMKTDGRPLNADIDLWQGPDNCPQKIAVYIEDGKLRPFAAVMETPRGDNAIAIRNTGMMEFPLTAALEAEVDAAKSPGSARFDAITQGLSAKGVGKILQGGAINTYPFAPTVASIQVLLETDGRPLNCRIELLQGPNNNKQIMDIYCEDGQERPFFAVLETPGSGNVVRVINTSTMEYPITTSVEPYETEEFAGEDGAAGYFLVD